MYACCLLKNTFNFCIQQFGGDSFLKTQCNIISIIDKAQLYIMELPGLWTSPLAIVSVGIQISSYSLC